MYFTIMKNAIKIIKKLVDAGYQAVLAGGCVRDKLMNITPHDFDIATNASPDTVVNMFEKTIEVGKAFGVIVVMLDNTEYEVATFRADGEYSDGRRPDSVTFVTMEEDAQRRDLTINGMFLNPLTNELLDFVDGKKDLRKGVIRLIGDPGERIEEDKLRMMRVARFATRFGFKIASRTMEAVKSHASEITQVSSERVADELVKILRLKNRAEGIRFLFRTKIIKHILPEVEGLQGVEQPPQFHPEGDCLKHTLMALEALPEGSSDELLLGTLLHDIGKPATFKIAERIRFDSHDKVGAHIAEDILKRLKFSNNTIERVVNLITNHMKWMCVQKMRVSRLKRFIRQPFFEEHEALHRVDCIASHGKLDNLAFVKAKKDSFPPEVIRPEPLIRGQQLIDTHFTPGPLFKEILQKVEDEQLEGTVKTRGEAIKFVKDNFVSTKKERV